MSLKTIAAIAGMGICTGAFAQLYYPNFTTTVGLNLVGTAVQNGNTIRVTPTINWMTGNVWAMTPQNVQTGFITDFTFRCFDGTPRRGADGIAFGIQANDFSQAGMTGGNLSMTGIPNAVAVVFRSFQNDVEIWRTNSNGDRGVIAHVTFSGISRPEVWAAHIEYVGATHEWTVKLDGTTVLTANYDIESTVQLASSKAIVGFGSATGGQNDNNDLRSWQFTPTAVPEPASMGILAIGVLALLRRRIKR